MRPCSVPWLGETDVPLGHDQTGVEDGTGFGVWQDGVILKTTEFYAGK